MIIRPTASSSSTLWFLREKAALHIWLRSDILGTFPSQAEKSVQAQSVSINLSSLQKHLEGLNLYQNTDCHQSHPALIDLRLVLSTG